MCRLTKLLSQPPAAMLPTGITPDGETTEYLMVIPGAMFVIDGEVVGAAVDAVWSTHVSSN